MKIVRLSVLLTLIGIFVIVTQGKSKEVIIASGTSASEAIYSWNSTFVPPPGQEVQRAQVIINNINAPGRPITYRIRAWEQVQNTTTCPGSFPANCLEVTNIVPVMDSGVVTIDGGETIIVQMGDIVNAIPPVGTVNFAILLVRVDWWVNQEGAIGSDVAALPLAVNFGGRREDSTGQTLSEFAIQTQVF